MTELIDFFKWFSTELHGLQQIGFTLAFLVLGTHFLGALSHLFKKTDRRTIHNHYYGTDETEEEDE